MRKYFKVGRGVGTGQCKINGPTVEPHKTPRRLAYLFNVVDQWECARVTVVKRAYVCYSISIHQEH